MSSIAMQPHDGIVKTAGDTFLTPIQQQAVNGYRRLQEEAERQGPRPATVVSMLPFSLNVSGPIYPTDVRIPGVPLAKESWEKAAKMKIRGTEVPYVLSVFNQWKPLQQKYVTGQIEGDFEEINDSGIIWPIEQAEDAVRQNSNGADRGGVFCYEGIHYPLKKQEALAVEQFAADTAYDTLMRYCTGYYEKVSDGYMSRQTTSTWRDLVGKGKYHRWIAQYLFNVGAIRELPEWYQEIAMAGGKHQPKCDQCKQNVEPDAPICRHCHRVLNPFEAFAKLMIDADTPGAKLAAKRLKDNELKVLMESGVLEQEWLEQAGIIVTKGEKKAK